MQKKQTERGREGDYAESALEVNNYPAVQPATEKEKIVTKYKKI